MKTGYKTSEFWVTAVSSLLITLNQSGILGDVALPVESIATIVGVIASYVISRGVAKLNA